MSHEQSQNWEAHKDLPYLSTGWHEGAYDEGLPRDRHGSFEIVTSWGQRVVGATIKRGLNVQDEPTWDVTRAEVGTPDRTHFCRGQIALIDVAGWRRIS
jgi:hypothetical protein